MNKINDDNYVVLKAIEDKDETQYIDFKQEGYDASKKYDILKDMVAFVNANSESDSYIIFGITDETREVCGITTKRIDVSTFNELIETNIEPYFSVEYKEFEHLGKTLAYIKIPKQNNQPYVVKRDVQKTTRLNKGDIFIRRGTATTKASRNDLDSFYLQRKHIEIKIYQIYLDVRDYNDEKTDNEIRSEGRFKIEIVNDSDKPLLLNSGYLLIRNQYNSIERGVYYKGESSDDDILKVQARDRVVVEWSFDFSSTDCLRMRIDERGIMECETFAKVILLDTHCNKYESEEKSVFLSAGGSVLHKVLYAYKEKRREERNSEDRLLNKIVDVLKGKQML